MSWRTGRIARNGLGLALVLLATLVARGQQDPMYTMYMWNMMAIQPAYAGSADVLNVTALTRAQWSGINGAPVTHSLSAHAPINRQSLGAGMSLVSDRIGRTGTTSVFGDLAYRMRISRSTRIALGLSFGLNHAQLNNTQVENTDPNDPLFATDLSGRVMPNFGFGLYLWSKRAYFGASAPKLKRNVLGVVNNEGNPLAFAEERPHVFITGGYVVELGDVMLKPAFMLRMTEGAPLSADLSLNILMRERIWLGAAVRNAQNLSWILSVQATDQFRVGYAYDHGLKSLGMAARGSHEVMFSYDPVFNRDRMRSPRYF